MFPPLTTPGPVIMPRCRSARHAEFVADVVGAARRLTLAVARTASPAMKPPGGRVGVRDGVRVTVAPPGVPVAVGGAGVRVGVAVGTGVRIRSRNPAGAQRGGNRYPEAAACADRWTGDRDRRATGDHAKTRGAGAGSRTQIHPGRRANSVPVG